MWVEGDVRAAVEDVDREVSLAGAAGGPGRRLEAVWRRLLDLLALGPAPELRACPYCGGMGMRSATRCGACWRDLEPLAAAAPQGSP